MKPAEPAAPAPRPRGTGDPPPTPATEPAPSGGDPTQDPPLGRDFGGPPEPGRARRWARFARLWYGRLLMLVAAPWLLYMVVRWSVSGRWHWSIVLDAVPPLFLVGVPLLLLLASAAACGRRRPWAAGIAAVSLLIGLLGGSGVNWGALGRDPGPVPPDALRVVALNTEYWGQETSVERIYDLLHAQDADVYLLQEHVAWEPNAGGEEAYSRIDDDERLLAEFPDHHISRRGELLTVSRFPIVAQPPVGPGIEVAADPHASFDDIFARDKVLRTDLLIDDEVVSFYNVHITAPLAVDVSPFTDEFDYNAYLQRKFSWRQEEFRGLTEDVLGNEHRMVIAGDFNASAAMRDFTEFRAVADDAIRASTDFLPLTWKFYAPPGFEFESNGFLDRSLPFWRLDWAFTVGDVTVHRYEFLPTDGVTEHRLQSLRITL